MSVKRRVKIYLDQRSVEDSPFLLKKISDNFLDDELEIEIKKSVDQQKVNNQRDEILELQSSDIAKAVLDKNDEDSWGKQTGDEDNKELTREAKIWRKELAKEGVKVSFSTILKSLLESML